jgi:hypothetical protein
MVGTVAWYDMTSVCVYRYVEMFIDTCYAQGNISMISCAMVRSGYYDSLCLIYACHEVLTAPSVDG